MQLDKLRTGLNKALIRNFIQHKLDELRKLKSHPSGDLDGLLLLWKFLQSLVITGGVRFVHFIVNYISFRLCFVFQNVSRSDVALLLSEDFIVHAEEAKVEPSIRASKPVTGHYSDQDYSDSEYPDHGYERAELLETGSQTANPAMNHYMGLLMQGEIKVKSN